MPPTRCPRYRILSPWAGLSILRTSAPRSAQIVAANGPATIWQASTTVNPASGPGMGDRSLRARMDVPPPPPPHARAGVIVAPHGHQRCQRNRHGWGIGNRGGRGAPAGREGRQGRRRRPSGGQGQGARRRDRRRVLQGRRHQDRRHRQRRRDGQEHGPGPRAGQLGRHRLGAAHGRQGRHLRLGRQPRRVQEGHRHQPDRHLRLHPHRRRPR